MISRRTNHAIILSSVLGLAWVLGGCGGRDTDANAARAVTLAPTGGEFSYAMYNEVLDTYVDERGFVDYAGLKADRKQLDQFVADMGAIDPDKLANAPEAERLALWINAYNAITLKYIIDHYPIEKGGIIKGALYPANSIRQIDGVWKKLETVVAGEPITLDAIEHQVLRKKFSEPRIHVAINCASVGCPPLRREAFVADRIDEQLAEQSRRFLADPDKFRIDREENVVYLSSILDWFKDDFVGVYEPGPGYSGHSESVSATLAFVAQYIPETDAAYLKDREYAVEYTDYDWSLNEQ